EHDVIAADPGTGEPGQGVDPSAALRHDGRDRIERRARRLRPQRASDLGDAPGGLAVAPGDFGGEGGLEPPAMPKLAPLRLARDRGSPLENRATRDDLTFARGGEDERRLEPVRRTRVDRLARRGIARDDGQAAGDREPRAQPGGVSSIENPRNQPGRPGRYAGEMLDFGRALAANDQQPPAIS